MALHYLTLESLKELDGGRVAEAFVQGMKRIVADCEDRPGEERSRVLTMQCEIVPVRDEEGHCDGVDAKFQIRDSIPTRRSKTYNFGIKAGGKLWFSDEDPTNSRQLGFGDVNPATGKAERELRKEE